MLKFFFLQGGSRDEGRRGRGGNERSGTGRDNNNDAEAVDNSSNKAGRQRRGRSSEGSDRRKAHEPAEHKRLVPAQEDEDEEEESKSDSEHDTESSQEVSWIQVCERIARQFSLPFAVRQLNFALPT